MLECEINNCIDLNDSLMHRKTFHILMINGAIGFSAHHAEEFVSSRFDRASVISSDVRFGLAVGGLAKRTRVVMLYEAFHTEYIMISNAFAALNGAPCLFLQLKCQILEQIFFFKCLLAMF